MKGLKLRRILVSLFLKVQDLKFRVLERYWRIRFGGFGAGARIALTARLYGRRKIVIGDGTILNDYVHVWGNGGVHIGNNCLIAAHSVITSQTHDVDAAMKGLLYKETSEESQVQIGDNVWIGSNVTILPGVSIGNGAVIGAGAVVARDLPDYVLAVGVPARVIRSLIRPIP